MIASLIAHRVETTLTKDGTLTLDRLPFHAGDAVEVIVLPHSVPAAPSNRYPLRGTPVDYVNPMHPIAEDDWDAII